MNRSKSAIFLGLAGAFVAGCLAPVSPADASAPAPDQKADSPGMDLARQLNDAFASVAEQVTPSVVVLEVTEKPVRGRRGGRRPMGEGSGIIVSKDGYILTNNHIVDNAATIKVYFKNGPTFVGEVRGTDPKTDIAVVKIDPGTNQLHVARLGDSDKLRVGEFVVAIGHPLELTYSVTVGHVSALGRQLPTDSYENISDDQEYIQTDAVINPGNSGGPLINLGGEVIAVNSMMEGYTDPITGFTQNRGIGLAIPMREAKLVMDRLIRDGKFTRSMIGIHMTRQPFGTLDMLTFNGVGVADVAPKGPADKAGLKADDIIVAVDGLPVKTGRDLRNVVALAKPGQSITLSVQRGEAKRPFQIKVVTEAEPPPVDESLVSISSGRPNSVDHTPEHDYGFSAKALSKDLAEEYGVDATSGVMITEMAPLSPAYYADLQPGDIITEMNKKPISSMKDFNAALKAVAPGDPLTMDVKRKDGTKFKVLHARPSE